MTVGGRPPPSLHVSRETSQRPQCRFLLDSTEQPIDRHLDVFPPGERGTQIEPQTGIARMRPHRLEASCGEMVRREDAARFLPPCAAERLDGLKATSYQILGNRLHKLSAEPL